MFKSLHHQLFYMFRKTQKQILYSPTADFSASSPSVIALSNCDNGFGDNGDMGRKEVRHEVQRRESLWSQLYTEKGK